MSDKHPGGAPTKYNKQFHPVLGRTLAQLGKTDKEISTELEIAESTLNLWKLKHPEFSESLKIGKMDINKLVENALLKRALGFEVTEEKVFSNNGEIVTHNGLKYFPPDVAAAFIWLKNRDPANWRDRKELVGDPNAPLQVVVLPAEKSIDQWDQEQDSEEA